MSWRRAISRKLTLLAILWLFFTLSLFGWWWYHALMTSASDERLQRMYFWEGGFLFLILSIGGAGLVYLTHHHQERHDRLKMFFSTFAHDLKTSISRLRLQGELLEESGAGKDAKVQAMLKDIHKLDLQLENSLWMSQLDSQSLLIQPTKLSEVMDYLRNEFSEMRFEMSRDAGLQVDRRAFAVILRNLFNNAILHGGADRIGMQVSEVSNGTLEIVIGDNGRGLEIPVENLGRQVLSLAHERSNGLGLYLCRRLISKMDGDLSFTNDSGFKVRLLLRGRLA
ncbi:MAG TPA: HAMP domain-containing sensor histidine kinase [Pseudobdellovibrionaceae bacterium]|nr:HAMP domain-containing sensor histidine kinase [Pseudobdellovibrionaceae bacterium]